MHAVTLHYSEALVRRAVLAFVWRSVWREMLVMVAITAAVVSYWALGDRSWGFGVLCGLVGLALVLPFVVLAVHYRQSVGKLRAMRAPQATLRWNEREFTLASDLGSSTLPWSSVERVWRFDEFWLLMFSRAQFVTLPLADLDEATRARIVDSVSKIS